MNNILQTDSSFVFRTKAETLATLKSRLKLSCIPDSYFFSVGDWLIKKDIIIQNAVRRFKEEEVIVRSSAHSEDMAFSAMAGVYDSIPHVDMTSPSNFAEAVELVIDSYKRRNSCDASDYILVQLMIQGISMSGVLFTQDLNTGAPYYVINYDDESGRTDTITAGTENSNRTLLVHRGAIDELHSERFKALLYAAKEIESLTCSDSLDIEFALDKNSKVYLFQVRPITTRRIWNPGIVNKVNDAISETKEFVKSSMLPNQSVLGKKTIFGRMPDWNPAEMIGTAPRPLALSLYSYLITDEAWNQARSSMGYKKLSGHKLMVSLSGQPYIDVRLSFNSFLPNDIGDDIGKKIVDAWIDRLSENKHLHDKIEFEVAITVLSFDFDYMVEKHMKDVLTKKEKDVFRKSLFNLTNNLITQKISSMKDALKQIEILEQRRITLIGDNKENNINTVFSLMNDCITYGTIPFSILARHAFISKSFLNALIREDLLTEDEQMQFLRSIKTVAGELVADFDSLALQVITPSDFLSKYGHLRPGTYDILSQRYDQRQDFIDGNIKIANPRDSVEEFFFSDKQLAGINELSKRFGFQVDAVTLIQYIKDSIIAREYSKFVFTKSISEALEILSSWGENIGLTRDDVSYLTIHDIIEYADSSKTKKKNLKDLIMKRRDDHEVTLALQLPYLIEIPEDVAIVPLFLNNPNFITKKKTKGRHVFLDGKESPSVDIDGYIVLVEGADPGFDWIFSKRIKGLITKFGGANSHIAIRCAEFGIPAAIGCGEQIFDRILRSRDIELNCAEGRIIPIGG